MGTGRFEETTFGELLFMSISNNWFSSCLVLSSVDSNKNVPSKLGGDKGADEKSNLFSIFNRCFLFVKLFT